MKTFTDKNFEEEVLKSDELVLVDFWASWCGPCRRLTPILETISKDNDKITIGKCNADENQKTAKKYNISAIPHMVFFKSGIIVHNLVGLVSRNKLEGIIKDLLK